MASSTSRGDMRGPNSYVLSPHIPPDRPHFHSPSQENLRDPSSYVWMSQNFLVNMQNVKQGRMSVRPLVFLLSNASSDIPRRWCLLTACFSHESTSHLLFNALSYFFMAPPVLALLGNTGFLALYLGGGIFASVASLSWRSLRGGRPTDSSHGASGPFSPSLPPDQLIHFPTSRNLRHCLLLCVPATQHHLPYLWRHPLSRLGLGLRHLPLRWLLCLDG